jgi:hypothetical protein
MNMRLASHVKFSVGRGRGCGICKTLEGGPHTMAAQGPHKAKSGPEQDDRR